jgi:hypothetical protein
MAFFPSGTALYSGVFCASALPFAIHVLLRQHELAFQRDWDDQVNNTSLGLRECTNNRLFKM